MGLQAEIWAWGLGGGGGTKEEKEKEEEKIPHMCESIGHRPLRGRCPKRMLGRQLALPLLYGRNGIDGVKLICIECVRVG